MPQRSQAENLLSGVFAPWVTDLHLRPVSFDETGARFVLPENARLVHVGGIICGQAAISAADTACVVTLSVLNGRFRICSTVDVSAQYIRPLPPGDVEIDIEVLSNGKRMAFARAQLRASGQSRIAVSANLSFAYLD